MFIYGAFKGTCMKKTLFRTQFFFVSSARRFFSFARRFVSFARRFFSFARRFVSFARRFFSFTRRFFAFTRRFFVSKFFFSRMSLLKLRIYPWYTWSTNTLGTWIGRFKGLAQWYLPHHWDPGSNHAGRMCWAWSLCPKINKFTT